MARTKNTAKKAAVAAKTAKAPEVETVNMPAPVVEPETVETPAPVEAANVIIDEAPATVTVGLNHPVGLKFRVLDKYGVEQVVEIAGNATGLRGLEKGILPAAGAYGLTPNVPAELWEAVKAKYRHMAIFRNGLIFAVGDNRSAKSEAKNRASLRNGAEPIEPKQTTTSEE